MILDYLVKMFFVFIMCPVLLAAVQTLTIDSQLGTSIEDCFERFSIGDQLPRNAIYRNVSELTTRECESLCKQDKQCQAYDYGVGAKGNATCNLSTLSEKELKEKNLLFRHPDYDIYVRRFQCEQSPPTPLQTQFDEPLDSGGPAHRPVFRPDDEDPRRPLEDYLEDSRPFETVRPDLINPIPPYRPQPYNYMDDRPDDYMSQKPALNAPPIYGDHRPQEIPFKPHTPYKPRPMQSQRPDIYDTLQIQDPHRPSRPDPGFWRPDPYHPPQAGDEIPDLYGPKPTRPYRPNNDPYDLEKPVYNYIVRPTRKPKPQEPLGPSRPEYHGPNHQGDTEKPSYSYNSQYASNYGQSTYQDNSIYVEIYDPPRPYRPVKKPYERPTYGSQSQGGYSQNYGYTDQSTGHGGGSSVHTSLNQGGSSQSYGHGTITEIHNHNPDYNQPPSSGGYGPTSGYGGAGTPGTHGSSGYGSPYTKPNPNKNPSNHYGSSHSQGSYDNQTYSAINRPSYGSQGEIYGPQNTLKPQRPSYGSHQGSYGSHQGSYGSHQGSYGSQQGSYGSTGASNQGTYSSKPSYNDYIEHHGYYSSQDSSSQSYGVSHGSYGPTKPIYPEPPPFDDRPSYGGYRPFYEADRPSYESQRPSHSNGRPGYGSNRPSYGPDRPPYGNKPSYSNDDPEDVQSPPYNKPSNDGPSYGSRPSYGSERPTETIDRPSYGNGRPESPPNNKPPTERPSYGDRPSGVSSNTRPGNDRPYGNDRPFDVNRPDPYYDSGPSFSSQGTQGYGVQSSHEIKPVSKPNETDYFNSPDIRPVYEHEMDKPNNAPSYIVRPGGEIVTSKPVAIGSYGEGYGRDKGHRQSYKGQWSDFT